jgi:hypothetical protein
MAHRQIGQHRYAQVGHAFAQHLLEPEPRPPVVVGGVATLEAAEGQSRQLLQGPGQPPVGQHPVDAVRRFAHIFEQQHRPLKRRAPAGAE